MPEQPDLGHWVSVQRKVLASDGLRTTVHDRLDQIDPDWHLRRGEREPVCSHEECRAAAVTLGCVTGTPNASFVLSGGPRRTRAWSW